MATYYLDENGKLTTQKKKKNGTSYVMNKDGKITEERTWFQKGEFADGYQFGDVTKTILGSAGDLLEDAGAGILGLGEKAVDALAYAAPLIAEGQYYQNGGLYQPPELQKANQELFRESKKSSEEFIKKDLYNEEKIAKSIISAPVKKVTGFDIEDASVFGSKSDSLAQSAGQLGATVALQAAGVPWFVTTGASSFGSEAESALNQGASYEEAGLSATINAGAEILTEKLSGGISFGGKTLDDVTIKPLTEKISNKAVKTLVNLGVDAAGEGTEEVISSVISNLGTSLYKEEDLSEILASEEALDEYVESFIGGAVLGGGSSAIQTIRSGNNEATFTENEQKVIDKEVEDRIKEREDSGETLTNKDKSAIEEQVKKDLEKGYISTDKIESTLGGDTYTNYKSLTEQESALKEEIESLENLPKEQITVKQGERLAEARQQLQELDTTTIKEQLGREVSEIAKSDRLSESYNERARRGQAFEADLTKYSEKERAVVQKAVESGILNNTNKTHDFVDMVAKLSAEKGVSFNFTDNQRLKESGFAVEGATVNGFVDGKDITLNIDSAKALNTVVGHEITHVLEGTELYGELQAAVKAYAETKGEYNTRLEAIKKLYEGRGADIEAEITADLVGDYLFTDSDFINRLSTEKPGVFKKIFDEIKYLYRLATAGSKEAKQLEKVKRAFEKAYREGGKATDSEVDSDVQYSITVTDKDTIDFLENQEHIVTYKAMQLIDGKLYPPMAAKVKDENGKYQLTNPSQLGVWQQATEDTKNIKKFKNGVGYYTLNKGDGSSVDAAYNPYEHSSNLVLNDQFESAHRRDNLVTVEGIIPVSEMTSGYKAEHAKDSTGVMDWKSGVVAGKLKDSKRQVYLSRWFKPVRILSEAEVAEKYREILDGQDVAVPFNVVPPALLSELEKAGVAIDYEGSPNYRYHQKKAAEKEAVQYSLSDSEGHQLTKEQQEYFKDSKVRDENGNLKVMHHGTASDFTVFNPMLQGGKNGTAEGYGIYFADSPEVTSAYGGNQLRGYLNITHPATSDKKTIRKSDLVKLIKATAEAEARRFVEDGDYDNVRDALKDTWISDYVYTYDIPISEAYSKVAETILSANFDDMNIVREVMGGNAIRDYESAYEFYDILKETLGIDGFITYWENSDTGERTQIAVAFDSNQFKNADNLTPTTDPDIRYSLGEDASYQNVHGFKIKPNTKINEDLLEELSIHHPEAEVDADGNVTVYHRTSKENAEKIRKTGIMTAKEDALFFSSKESGYASDYGDTVLSFKIPSTVLEVNDIFDGEVHFDIPLRRVNNQWAMNVSKYLYDPSSSMSLSEENRQPAQHGSYNIYGQDIALKQDIAPVADVVQEHAAEQPGVALDDYAPMTEDQANERDEQQLERLYTLDEDADMPWEVDAPYTEESTMPESPFDKKDIKEVGNRSIKAYMYENPEVKPFFQEEAQNMLGELKSSIKGEKWYNGNLHYETSGDLGWFGTDRMTSPEIAYLLDNFKYTYAEIEKGLNAIIEDHGAENNAVSKRIEFLLDERLREGYKHFMYGDEIPPNQDYINLLAEKQITEYNDEAFNAWVSTLKDSDVPEDVAPAREAEAPAKTETEAAPLYDAQPKKGVVEGQLSMVEEPEAPKKLTRSELHSNIMDNIKIAFGEKGLDFDDVLNNAKNLSTFRTVDNTPQRVIEKALGYKEGQVLNDLTVNHVAQNETEGIRWLNSFTDRKRGLLAQISKQYGIKPGSKESAAAQMYAEGFYVAENNDIIAYGDAELAKDFPNRRVQENIKALAKDGRIRRIYDETLRMINESRTRNAYPEIPRLDNYFLHFRAMDDTFSRLGLPFNPNDIRAKDLPTDLNGVTADLKPGQPYFASAMHRTGQRTSFDLLGGLERYLTSAKNQIYHIDDIQTLRALRNYIADTYGQAKGLEGIDTLSEEEAQERISQVYGSHLSTFAKFLNEEANTLAGKTALIDRGLEGIIGRRGITFLDTVNRQVGANMVGFNVSSSLTNFISVVQAFAKSNKASFVKAFAQTTANKLGSLVGRGDGFADQSPVMIRRRGADRFYRTPWQKAGDAGYFLMGAVDNISTELIARTKYNELVSKGMDAQKAHYETDKWVSRLMGDRSLGQQPQLYNSKMLGLLTKFQLEVRNQLDSQFYDTIQEAKVSNEEIENRLARNARTAAKVTSTFFQLAVAQHLFGKAFESIAGYNPAFDIIGALIKAFGFDDDEESEDTVLDNVEQGFLELLGDLPYASTFTGGRIPIESALPIEQFITGKDDYGNEKSRLATLGEAAPYYLLPSGYGQIKKTYQGSQMFDDDLPIAGSYTDSGNLRFAVEDTTENRLQAGLFGQWASDEARDYFDNERSPLKEKQIQELVDLDLPIREYWDYRKGLSEQSTLEDKFEYINSQPVSTEQKNIMINNVVDRKEPVDMSNYNDFADYEEFDFYTKNTEKYNFLQENGVSYSEYKSSEEAKEEYDNAYSWVKNNPDKVTVAKAVTDNVIEYRRYTSALNDIRADKDASGKTINGSAKEKKIAYIDSLNIDYGAKLILFKSEYKSDDTYNYELLEYLNSRDDITWGETVSILTELGFTVRRDGTVEW